MDYTYAPEHNFTYIVQWDRQRSIEPANVNDDELVGFGPVVGHPLSQHTVSPHPYESQPDLIGTLPGHDLFPQPITFHLSRAELCRSRRRERWRAIRFRRRVS
jgi:hypothetical protein